MKPTLRRFTLKQLLAAIAVTACLVAIVVRAQRIHNAARFIESHGGDVWCDELLYTGSGFGVAPNSKSEVLRSRMSIVSQILLGTRTDLWVCYVPDDRQRFSDSLAVLNPSEITFEVLGPKDFAWVSERFPTVRIRSDDRQRFPTARIRSLNALEEVDTKATSDATSSETVASKPASDQQTSANFTEALELFDKMRADNPRLFYRLERYETLIGYPAHGEMGRLHDKLTGRIIYLPWPR